MCNLQLGIEEKQTTSLQLSTRKPSCGPAAEARVQAVDNLARLLLQPCFWSIACKTGRDRFIVTKSGRSLLSISLKFSNCHFSQPRSPSPTHALTSTALSMGGSQATVWQPELTKAGTKASAPQPQRQAMNQPHLGSQDSIPADATALNRSASKREFPAS